MSQQPTPTRPSLRAAVQALRAARRRWAAQHWPAAAAAELARIDVLVAHGVPLRAAGPRAVRGTPARQKGAAA